MEYESLSAQIVTLKLVNTKFKARITELEARLKEAENELAEAKAQWASPVYARLEKAEARAEAAEAVNAALFKERTAAINRAEKAEADAGRLRDALKWWNCARQAALSPAEQSDDEKGVKG